MEAKLEEAELEMLRFSLGVTRMNKGRNELIGGTDRETIWGQSQRDSDYNRLEMCRGGIVNVKMNDEDEVLRK